MRLLKVSRVRGRCDVVAVMTPAGKCQVIEFLRDAVSRYRPPADDEKEDRTSYESNCQQLFALLRDEIPNNGPPKKMPDAKPLGDGLWEFRKNPRGKKLRLTWFEDGARFVVCVLAFTKRSTRETSPRDALSRSRLIKKQYFEDKKRGSNTVEAP